MVEPPEKIELNAALEGRYGNDARQYAEIMERTIEAIAKMFGGGTGKIVGGYASGGAFSPRSGPIALVGESGPESIMLKPKADGQ